MRKYGHRGACGHAPENTLLSMQKALALGVHGVEFDIQLSRDGEPMVIHDDTLDRTTNGKGRVIDFTYKELQQFDAGRGEKIPHLNDIFTTIDKRGELLIELKDDAVDATESVIRHHINKGWDYAQIRVLSFNHLLLAKIRRINPAIRTCASLDCVPVTLAAIAQEAGASTIGPYIGTLEKALIDDAHWRGLDVITWTVNDALSIAKAKALDVDGIISDFPERL